MKRYEKYSGEEIVALMEQCNKAHYDLADCPIGKGNLGDCPDDCLLTWLKSDVQLVQRWQTIRCQEDLKRMWEEARDVCVRNTCDTCRLYNAERMFGSCFCAYLSERVEKLEGGMD